MKNHKEMTVTIEHLTLALIFQWQASFIIADLVSTTYMR